MNRIFADTEAVVKFALLILGLLPTAAVLTGVIDIPPSLKQLLALILAIIGLGTAVIALLVRNALRRPSAVKISILFGICLLFGCIGASLYYDFARKHVVYYHDQPVIVPLRMPDTARKLIDEGYGGDVDAALNGSNRGAYLYQVFESNNSSATFVAVLLLALSQFLIIFGLLGALLRAADSYADAKGTRSSGRATPTPETATDPTQ